MVYAQRTLSLCTWRYICTLHTDVCVCWVTSVVSMQKRYSMVFHCCISSCIAVMPVEYIFAVSLTQWIITHTEIKCSVRMCLCVHMQACLSILATFSNAKFNKPNFIPCKYSLLFWLWMLFYYNEAAFFARIILNPMQNLIPSDAAPLFTIFICEWHEYKNDDTFFLQRKMKWLSTKTLYAYSSTLKDQPQTCRIWTNHPVSALHLFRSIWNCYVCTQHNWVDWNIIKFTW